jgi:hypothetical protein
MAAVARNVQQDARRILDRLEVRYGADPDLRQRMLPVLVRILEGDPGSHADLLRLVVRAYEHHVKVRRTLDLLRGKLRERLNDVYGRVLGIEPPRVG